MTTQALSAYRSHDLNIKMQTSSGDVIRLDLSNEKSLQYASQKGENGSKSVMKFASMQSFQFSVDSKNGIDEQDKKEIEKFMEIAKPYLDKFMDELKNDAPKSPVTKIAQNIADIFAPATQKDENLKNIAKNSVVELFDKELEKNKSIQEQFDKLFEESKKLLEKTLHYMDNGQKNLYA